MSTRSDIIVKRADGTWARIYCHFDGYISGVGAMLQAHYNSQELAEALVAPGDVSSIGKTVGTKHSFDNPPKDVCNYYGRDRGEDGCEARVGATLEAVWPPEDTWTEFTYVWAGGEWFVTDPDDGASKQMVSLKDAIAMDEKGENAVKSLVKTPFGAIAKRK